MKFLKTMTLAASVSMMSLSPLANAAQESYGVIFMDRSGSMMTTRPDGQSRCAYSHQIALQKVNKFFYDNNINGQKLDVKVFSSGGQLTSITNGFTDAMGATIALYGLNPEGCGGLTALAEAACVSADDLRNSWTTAANNGALLRVYGSTDGDENNSPVANCGGSNWQAEVLDKYLAVQPAIQFNVDLFVGNVQKAATKSKGQEQQDYRIAEDVGYEGKKAQATKALSTFDFMRELAAKTGGVATDISDTHGDSGSGEW